ncbi:MAG: glycoside hydrolase family 97 catalytic domain-containing protein [Bacteroidota bacterium]
MKKPIDAKFNHSRADTVFRELFLNSVSKRSCGRQFSGFLFLFSSILMWHYSAATNSAVIHSPSGNIKLTVIERDGEFGCSVGFRDKSILSCSPFGYVLRGKNPLTCFLQLSSTIVDSFSTYSMPWGTASAYQNHFRELSLKLVSCNDSFPMTIRFRVYDDGWAFRYESDFSGDSLLILKETSTFRFQNIKDCWWSWADYNTLEKEVYSTEAGSADHVALPFTAKIDSSIYISVLEAGIDDYTTMTLLQDSLDSLVFHPNLVPWSDGVGVRVNHRLQSPWRAFIISSDPAGLLSSNLLLNLNDPPGRDFSWVKPMKYIGIWWEMHLGISTWKKEGGRHGATTKNALEHIDFAADNDFQGVLIEGWNTGWENWGQKGAFDFTTPYDDFNLQRVVEDAIFRKIDLIGHHETGGDIITYENRLDSAFSIYKRLGVRYVKTGYAGPVNPPTEHHHGQYMVKHMNTVMRKAADYGIALDVHEPVIPSGLGRTYPNLMTFEGVRGMEWNAWSDGNPPSHTCLIPFTRGLAGPMDYTPGIFDITEDNFSEKRIPWNGLDRGSNSVHSTLSNQLALMVINYSPLQMAADLPSNYIGHPALKFISLLPTAWDESLVLGAAIGEYIVVARRKGTTWFVAGITNEYSRSFQLPTDFLLDGKQYDAEICTDLATSHYENNPDAYSIRHGTIRNGDDFDLWMAPGGGEFLILSLRK